MTKDFGDELLEAGRRHLERIGGVIDIDEPHPDQPPAPGGEVVCGCGCGARFPVVARTRNGTPLIDSAEWVKAHPSEGT